MGTLTTPTTTTASTSTPHSSRWHLLHAHHSPPPLPAASSDDVNHQHWSSFDSSVNAVSFGFVATAILVSMFLVMAIFERFLRPSPDASPRPHRDAGGGGPRSRTPPGFHPHVGPGLNPKLGFPSPKMTVYTKGVSVLMPGEEFPTFIAHPVPVPCPPERISWPIHQQNHYWNPTPINPNRNSSNRRQTS